jgi:predicted MPP superfamily phosphohydrolase
VGRRERDVIRMINDLQPDIIAITGDIIYSRTLFNNLEKLQNVLVHVTSFITALEPKYGLYICRGNNDFSDDKEKSDLLLEVLENAGAIVLTDRRIALEINGKCLVMLGVDFTDFFREVAQDFTVREFNGNRFLESGSSSKNSYSNYYDTTSEWSNYTFSGKMAATRAKSGIGVLVYSQFNRGYDRFYRLVGSSEVPFQIAPHGTKITGGDRTSDVLVRENTWYRFRIEVDSGKDRTGIRAKIWPDGSAEPGQWQIDVFDDSPSRLGDGTVGAYSIFSGKHRFDDFLVVAADGDTLLYEDFEDVAERHSPWGWVAFNHNENAIPFLMRDIADSCYTVLLAHPPDFVTIAEPEGVDLVLSGHTHGGQIRLPFIGPLYVYTDLGRRYVSGFHDYGQSKLYVSRGVGTISLPVRFLCPPEIAVIDLF